MTRAAGADHLPNECSLEVPLVLLIVVARPRNEVMARQRFFATANRARPLHESGALLVTAFERQLGDARFVELAETFGDHALVLLLGCARQRQIEPLLFC